MKNSNLASVVKQNIYAATSDISLKTMAYFTGARSGQTVCLTQAGYAAAYELLAQFWQISNWNKKSTIQEYFNVAIKELIEIMIMLDAERVDVLNLDELLRQIDLAVAETSKTSTYYEGCHIVPHVASPFEIGPVKFTPLEFFIKHPPADNFPEIMQDFLQNLIENGVVWLAVITVEDHFPSRGEELASLQIDMALAGLQQIFPVSTSKGMRRYRSLNLPHDFRSINFTDGNYRGMSSWSDTPGFAYHGSFLDQLLVEKADVFSSFGRRVAALSSEKVSEIELAWCGAAYWYREGIVEPLDTIAVSKLETCLEVLFRTENARGSKTRILRALELFTGKSSDEIITKDGTMTVDDLAKKIVEDRSRILHGTLSTLNHDAKFIRSVLTQITPLLLTHFCTKLDEYMCNPQFVDTQGAYFDWIVEQVPAKKVNSAKER